MANWPSPTPSDGRIGAIDRFCMLTYQASSDAARYAGGMASTLGFLCVVLMLSLGVAVWHANAMEQQRDALVQELRNERAAKVEATLAVSGVQMDVAARELDTQVRRDIVDEKMLEQEQRSAELAKLAETVERQKLVEADCVTPRSIMAAAGL
jgi:hypothetical protein